LIAGRLSRTSPTPIRAGSIGRGLIPKRAKRAAKTLVASNQLGAILSFGLFDYRLVVQLNGCHTPPPGLVPVERNL
jgi:hypothetical protein